MAGPISQTTKVCTFCKVDRPLNEFARKGTGRRSRCRSCCAAADRSYREGDPGRFKEMQAVRRRRHYVRHQAEQQAKAKRQRLEKYGLDAAGFAALLEQQGGVCAICRAPETARHQNGEVRSLAVDHDHATGAVRGLLCTNCNHALGKFKDDPTRLRAALAYLTRGGQ